jgi:hypothetical protein
MADASIYISCAMSLAVFNILKYTEKGRVIEPDMEQKTGTIRDDCKSLTKVILTDDCRYSLAIQPPSNARLHRGLRKHLP